MKKAKPINGWEQDWLHRYGSFKAGHGKYIKRGMVRRLRREGKQQTKAEE